jgi:hypothetical protein
MPAIGAMDLGPDGILALEGFEVLGPTDFV